MARAHRSNGTRRLVGGEAQPCVWMTARLLAYKLCDRDYDCEHCPLDAALRGAAELPRPLETLRLHMAAWTFPSDRLYHAGHLWAKALAGDRVRCGLDAFAARLVAPVVSVVLPAVNSRVIRDRVGLWLSQPDELVPLCAPLSGIVIGRNAALLRDPSPAVEDPYGEGWLVEVRCRPGLASQRDLIDAAAMRELARNQADRIRQRAARRAAHGRHEVGATAADGGEPLIDLRHALGEADYRRVVQRFLG